MTGPHVSFALLDASGARVGGWDEQREYYAASTVKLAVAAALLFAVETGGLTLEQTVPSRRRFASRIPDAPDFDFALEPEELDPGLPRDGTPIALGRCLERMLVVSSNEATNLVVDALGAADGAVARDPGATDGVRGLDAVRAACERLGVPDVRMTRLICDYAAAEAGFTHAATALDLARLMREVTCGDALRPESRDVITRLLRAQRFPIIAESLPHGVAWGSKSGWDDGIRHDVAFIGAPGTADYRVLAVCTEGHAPRGAQAAIRAVAAAALAIG